jgi:predicted dehydrogenase
MTDRRWRAALIGCGGVSRSHSEGLQAARNVELIALADVYEPNLRAAGSAYGVDRQYLDYHELLEKERPDIITICTQAPQHAQIAIDAAEAGVKGIICEKPIALTLAEADQMIAACDRHGARLAINHQTRMIPSTFTAERIVLEGQIGDMRVGRMLDKGGRPAGNSLMELCTHIFDLLRIYAGDPSWVSGHFTVGDAEGRQRLATIQDIMYSEAAWKDRDCGLVIGDRCSATFGFGPREGWHKGMTATLESFFQLPDPKDDRRWGPNLELIGTGGILFLEGTSNHVGVILNRGPWAPPGHLEVIETPPRPIAPGPFAARGARAPHHTGMVEELVAAIEEGREHRSSGRDGRWALEMIMGIYESHRRDGARVTLPLPDRGHPLQTWIDQAGARQPVKPASSVRNLKVTA